jgi:hypothetical protein
MILLNLDREGALLFSISARVVEVGEAGKILDGELIIKLYR